MKIDKKDMLYCLLAVLLVAGVCFGLRSDLHGDGDRIDAIRDTIDGAVREQREAIDGIERVESGLDSLESGLGAVEAGIRGAESGIAGAAGRIDQSAAELTSDAERLRECQRILGCIRARGQTDRK